MIEVIRLVYLLEELLLVRLVLHLEHGVAQVEWRATTKFGFRNLLCLQWITHFLQLIVHF